RRAPSLASSCLFPSHRSPEGARSLPRPRTTPVRGRARNPTAPRSGFIPWTRKSPSGLLPELFIFRRGFVAFVPFKPDEAPNRDVFSQRLNGVLDDVLHRLIAVLDEGLLHQANFFQKPVHPAFDDFVDDMLGLAFV